MDDEGDFVGEICHIEAASEGGERFNPDQSNEDRRGFDNLLLLCHRHHVKTNDVNAYPVSKLKEIKAAHERKYSQIEEKMNASITDASLEGEGVIEARNLLRVLEEVGDFHETRLAEMSQFAERVRELPLSTRSLLCIAARRATEKAERSRDWGGLGSLTLNPGELEKATNLSHQELRDQIRILDDHGFADLDDNCGDGPWTLHIYGQGDWTRLLEDLVQCCKKHRIPLEEILVALRFDLLDIAAEESA